MAIFWSEPVVPYLAEKLARVMGVSPVRHHFVRMGEDVYGVMEFEDGSTVTADLIQDWERDHFEHAIALAKAQGSEILE